MLGHQRGLPSLFSHHGPRLPCQHCGFLTHWSANFLKLHCGVMNTEKNCKFLKRVFLKIFIYFMSLFFSCAGSSLLLAGFLWLLWVGAALWLHCEGFLFRRLLLLHSMSSRHASFNSCILQTPEHGLSRYGTWAQWPCAMWELPGPGIEPCIAWLLNHWTSSEAHKFLMFTF